MNSLKKEIFNFIKKAGRKIKLNFVINKGLVGLKYLLSLIYIVIVFSLILVVKERNLILAIILSIGIISIIIYSIIKSPDKKRVALILDSKGLDERLSTALEFIDEEDYISLSQREDTAHHIRRFDFLKIKFSLSKKELLKVLAVLVVCIFTMGVETEARIKAHELKLFEIAKEETIETFEEEIKKIEENDKLSQEEKEAIKDILEKSKEDLLEASNKEELEKALERSEHKLKEKEEEIKGSDKKEEVSSLKDRLFEKFNKEKQDVAKNDINNLMNKLIKEEKGKELANAILSGDEKQLEEALANLREEIKNMTPDELSKLSKALEKAASEMDNEELKEALEKASKDVKKGEIDASELKDAIKKTQDEAKGENEESGEGESSGEGEAAGEGSGEGAGSEGGEGSNGSGQGEGTGGSEGGSGANLGSDEGEEGEGEPKKGAEIFIPGREIGSDENLQGNTGSEGESQTIETESGVNLDGQKVEYEKVVGDYTNSALESINSSNMPEGLKNIIKDYFNGIN